jgi:glycerate kinase
MHVLLAPDKFKGSLRASEVAAAVAAGLHEAAPGVPTVPVADGGDGTLDAAVAADYRLVPCRVAGPTGEPVDTGFAVRDGVAVVELADACGLNRLPAGHLAPLTATTVGFGQVIAAALDSGCHRVVLGVGGSASTDGGAGMLTALGARLLDAAGLDLPAGGAALEHLDRVDLSGIHPSVGSTEFVLASDVDNPLLGPTGAATVYGPQKGATPDDVTRLDGALRRWSTLLAGAMSRDAGQSGHPAAEVPGAGAAGGSRVRRTRGAARRGPTRYRPDAGTDRILREVVRCPAGDHRGGVIGQSDPARQGPRRGRRCGPPRRRAGGRGGRTEPAQPHRVA